MFIWSNCIWQGPRGDEGDVGLIGDPVSYDVNFNIFVFFLDKVKIGY